MTASLRSFAAVALPAVLVLSSIGCSTLGRGGKCKSCDSNQVYTAPSYIDNSGGGSAPVYAPPSQLTPIPVPPAEFPDTPVPPPPSGAAARPNAIQRMQGSTTAFFLNANENVRRTFRR
jgi:hypothetical protein